MRRRRYNMGAIPISTGTVNVNAGRHDAGSAHPYVLGYRFEAATMGVLERRGWWTHRAHGSKGLWDVLALRFDQPVLMIQAKLTGDIGSTAWNDLYELATRVGAVPVITFRKGERAIAFMRIDGPRVPRKHGRPWTEIDPRDLSEVPVQLSVDLAA